MFLSSITLVSDMELTGARATTPTPTSTATPPTNTKPIKLRAACNHCFSAKVCVVLVSACRSWL